MTEADGPGRPEETGTRAQQDEARYRSSPAGTTHDQPPAQHGRSRSRTRTQPHAGPDTTGAGTWLLTTTADSALEDPLAHRIGQALEDRGGHCTILGRKAVIGQLTGATGIIAIAPHPSGPAPFRTGTGPDRRLARWLARLLRHLPDLSGTPPRLCVVTRRHHSSPHDAEQPDGDQRLTDLLHMIETRYPRLRTTHIDLHDAPDPQEVAAHVLGPV
ncbi:hypothetical protein, partial [Streptomyces monomycini]|uniref:hypothetical protein n=1 Tax=Streptomyces monomycini TaxID=371720 RepID=UPI0004AA4DB9